MNWTQHRSSRVSRLAGLVLLAICALTFSGRLESLAQGSPQNMPAKRVLMLFNEGKEAPANLILEQAVRAELQQESTNLIEFQVEYLDASHFTDPEHFRLFQEHLGKKYAGQKLDLILAFPSRGDYRIAAELPEALFPEVPVVFVTVNEFDVPPEIGKLGVTGIVQRFDIRHTLALMLRLQPDTRRIVVVGGVSEVDRTTLGRIAEVAQVLAGIQFDYWTNRPMAELPAEVKSLPEGTVILLSTVLADKDGQAFYMPQLARLLAPVASVPVYVLGSWVLGSGALGGSVVDEEDLGIRAGRLAHRVMDGASPALLPIEVSTKGRPMADWRALQRWGIDESRMPADAFIRYRPKTLWGEHRNLILLLLAVFLAQAATIAGLLAQRRRRFRAEVEILNQRTELAHVTRVSTMGQLSSALTHELTQPLAAILRNTETAELLMQKGNPDWREVQAILADIRRDDQRAGSVIEKMRSLLKRRSLELTALDLRDLLAETIALTQPDARARHVNMILLIPARLPAIRGDRVHLQQVLLNLILNGMDAMAGIRAVGRQLTVRAETAPDGSVVVSVSDRGTGIPADNVGRLFEPFFTTKSGGLGMGLAISQTIIEAHGGKIWAENNPVQGAVLKFSLATHHH